MTTTAPSSPESESSSVLRPAITVATVGRAVLGGTLMGLANLVPGISGGTMLLAAGIYPRFIDAVAQVTSLRLRRDPLIVLGLVVAPAMLAILLLAGPVKTLVVEHRWVMYSLFIGLTLGGVPVVGRMIGRLNGSASIAAVVGFAVMAVVAILQSRGIGEGGARDGWLFMFLAGIAGASAMILPGISGGYLLLVLGVYVPILAAIDAVKDALSAMDAAAIATPVLRVVAPVGIGVVLGVALVSHALRWLMQRCEKATLGFLLGLLFGAVVGLWPFQEAVTPSVGDTLKGQTVIQAEEQLVLEPSGKPIAVEDYPTRYFRPGAGQAAAAVGLIVVGFLVTALIARAGGKGEQPAKA